MSNKGNLAKNTLILSMGTIINKGLMFIMVPIFTRWLSVEDYGSYDLFATYVSLLIPIITLSSSNAIFRLSIDAKDDLKKSYIANGMYMIIINIVLSISILYFCNYLYNFDHFIFFVIMLVCEVMDNYFQGYLRALKKLSIYGICKSVTTIFSAIMICVFIRLFNLGLEGLILGYSVGYLASSILIIIVTKFWEYLYLVEFSFKRIKELINYSWALIPNDISWWIISVSDRQIINMFIGAAANGLYAISYKIPNLCTSIFGVFNISWQESATEVLNDNDREVYYNSVLNNIVLLLLSLCIGIVACNFLFFDYIFDIRYSEARLYSPILLAAVIFSTISLFYGGIQISLKMPKANGISTIIGAISNLLINICLIKYIGLYAAALSTLISNIIVMYTRKRMLINKYSFRINKKYYYLYVIYLYYSIIAMIRLPLMINILHLFIAGVLFIIANFKYIKKIKNKLI